MQEKIKILPNKLRTQQTKIVLKTAARALFLTKGFAGTGTEEIVKSAGVTRGALYHHYDEKRALFEEIIEDELCVIAQEIGKSSQGTKNALNALRAGSDAFIMAMASEGRTKLILIEAPSVLGRQKLIEIEDRYTRKALKVGLMEAINAGTLSPLPLDALLEIMSSVFDSASLSIEAGIPAKDITKVVNGIIDGLTIKSN